MTIGNWAGIGALPTTRTEYYTPGLTWNNDEGVTSADCSFTWGNVDSEGRQDRFAHPGPYTRQWNDAPFGPGGGFLDLTRANDTVFKAAMLSEQDADSGRAPYAHMSGTSTLRDTNGTIVATSDLPGWARPWQRPAPGKYQLTVDAQRTVPWSDLATRQHVVWAFDVNGAERVTLPTVRYGTTLDINDQARSRSHQMITLIPDGLGAAPTGRTPSFWVSYDDGATWQQVTLHPNGGQWVASFSNPKHGYVSLRTTIAGVVDQTVIRAYGVR